MWGILVSSCFFSLLLTSCRCFPISSKKLQKRGVIKCDWPGIRWTRTDSLGKQPKNNIKELLRGGVKCFLCSPLPWEMIQFDQLVFFQWFSTSNLRETEIARTMPWRPCGPYPPFEADTVVSYESYECFWKWWVFPPNHPLENRVFHYKPSILGYPYFWKHPCNTLARYMSRWAIWIQVLLLKNPSFALLFLPTSQERRVLFGLESMGTEGTVTSTFKHLKLKIEGCIAG